MLAARLAHAEHCKASAPADDLLCDNIAEAYINRVTEELHEVLQCQNRLACTITSVQADTILLMSQVNDRCCGCLTT